MEIAGHSQPTFDSPNSSDHTESKRYCAERYRTEEEIYIAGTTFASNRLEMSSDSDFKPRIWALLAFGSLLMVNIGGHFPTGKFMPLIAAVGWSSLYRFFFAGRGDIITVTLKANPHMSLGESRSEGKGSAPASVLMVGNGVLAVERITSLPLKGGKDVILSGTRFRSPPGITASQRCLDPTRFTTAPQFQSPGQQSSYPLLHFSAPTPLHFSAPPPSPTTTRKETAHSQTFKSPIHAKKRRNNAHSRIAHTTSNNTTTTATTIDTLHRTLHISPAQTQQASALDQTNMSQLTEDMDRFFNQYVNDDAYANDMNMPINDSDVSVPEDAIDSGLDVHGANNDIELTEDEIDMVLSQYPEYMCNYNDLNAQNGMVSDEDQNWVSPPQNNFSAHPVSPTNTDSSSYSQQPFTPQSWDSPTYDQGLLQYSPSTPSPDSSYETDFEMMVLNPSPAQTPSPAYNVVPAPSENWVLDSPFNPINSTPTSPGLQTPSTPLTPDPSPPSPTTSSKKRDSNSNGPGCLPKPLKPKRRPSNHSGIVKPLRCEFPGDADSGPCNKEFDRKCDLKKHAKRHVKPFPCRFEGCKNIRGFSSEKDRERHENCLHKKECLMCTECKHETPRKDNMKDHVSRKHGKHVVDEIMRRIMAAPRTSPRPDGEDSGGEEQQ